MDLRAEKTKRIIFVTISMTGGGTERVIATLANYWARNGYKITILMIGGDSVEYDLDSRILIQCVSKATGGNLSARVKRIRAMREEFKKDESASIIAMGTVASLFSSVASVGLKNRLIMSERNDPEILNHKPIKYHERQIRNMLYMRAYRIVFQSEMAMESFPQNIKEKGVIIMNPLREDMPIPAEYCDRDRRVITAGRLTKRKNQKLLIDGFVGFHSTHTEYTLDIFGDGELREFLENYIIEKNAEDYITIRGFSKEIYSEMNKSSIYISTSDSEGISNSLMEAMAMGLAVIATDCPVGGSASLIQDGVNGRLIPVGDYEELVNAINEVSVSQIACNYADEAKKVRERYSTKSVADKWEELL